MKYSIIRKTGILAITICMLIGTRAISQTTVSSEVISQKLSSIYQVYDSMNYMSFDMRMVMEADSIVGHPNLQSRSEQTAKLTIAGKRYRYEIGENVFMQGDSFVIAVYKPAQALMLDRAKPMGANSLLPGGKSALDSLMARYTGVYSMFTDTTQNGNRLLLMHTNDSSMPYRDIVIEYDKVKNYLISTSYTFYTTPEDTIPLSPQSVSTESNSNNSLLQKHTLTTYYLNYRFNPQSFGKAFSEAEFIYYDGKKYWPSDAYRSYQFYNMVSE